MKFLYDPDSLRYTSDGNELDRQAHAAIDGIFRQWAEQGYSPREIAHLISWTVSDVELTHVLDAQHNAYERRVVLSKAQEDLNRPINLDKALLELTAKGQVIDAIKLRRTWTRDSLKEAKDYVDKLRGIS